MQPKLDIIWDAVNIDIIWDAVNIICFILNVYNVLVEYRRNRHKSEMQLVALCLTPASPPRPKLNPICQ